MRKGEGANLCSQDGCRRNYGHIGKHDPYPTEAWSFFEKKDKNKLTKAGFATPRGGRKGAYQNHVLRSNQVIIPYERISEVDLDKYRDGYVIRLFPDQYFSGKQKPYKKFLSSDCIVVGKNAFVLYRSYESYNSFPPMPEWHIRRLLKDGSEVNVRDSEAVDDGHFVLRLPRLGTNPKKEEGPPQGIFAPEYANSNDNFLCKCVLAWLIVRTSGSPYTTRQATHLHEILKSEGLDSEEIFENHGILRRGITCCPLCLKFIRYKDLHETISFEEETSLENAAPQIVGATRSTIVNLFHLEPLLYNARHHHPQKVAWGHATCNTRLGQRRCYSLHQLREIDLKVGIIREDSIDTFGWISDDDLMIRSPGGAVWIQLHGDGAETDTEIDVTSHELSI